MGFDKDMNNSIFMFGFAEFSLIPCFLGFGWFLLGDLGQKLIYVVYLVIFATTGYVCWRLNSLSPRAQAAYLQMWVSKWVVCGINTHIPHFIRDFFSGIPQYTDNMALSLAIGDVLKQWDSELQALWVKSWAP